MADKDYAIFRVDPFRKLDGMVFASLIQRVHDFVRDEAIVEADPEILARTVAVKAWQQDKTLLLLAALTPEGKLVGHALAEARDGGGRNFLYVLQCKVDPEAQGGDIVRRFIQMGDDYIQTFGGTVVKMETRKTDKAWHRAYGFKSVMHLMVRDIRDKGAE